MKVMNIKGASAFVLSLAVTSVAFAQVTLDTTDPEDFADFEMVESNAGDPSHLFVQLDEQDREDFADFEMVYSNAGNSSYLSSQLHEKRTAGYSDHAANLTEVESVKSAVCQENGWEYYYRGITNLFQRAYGDQIAPSNLRATLTKLLNEDKTTRWQGSKATYVGGGWQGVPMYMACQKDDHKFIVTAPAHDLDDNVDNLTKVASGNLPLNDVLLQIIQDNPQGEVEVCVPIAQTNSYLFGAVKRNHWITLKCNIEEGKIVSSDLYDSKGWFSSLYGGPHRLISKLPNFEGNVKSHFLGHQGLINNNDCGRFAASYIKSMGEGEEPTEMTTSQATRIFSWF
jgi:hypothetical protein